MWRPADRCDTPTVTTPITSELIGRTGAALGAGGWRYTQRQLYYATCAAAESPSRAAGRGELAAGVLLGLVALILLPFRPVSLAVGILAVIVLGLGVVARLTRQRLPGRMLGVSYSEFQALLPDVPPLSGLIANPGAAPLPPSPGTGASLVAVCDTAETAAAVRANFGVAALDPIPVVTLGEAEVDGSAVIALHDASPRGCALALELVDAGARVVDAGLRPAWVEGSDVQVLEGAPARLPRDLAPVLSEDEIAWLRSGRRVEIAILPPARLMRLVGAAADRASQIKITAGSPPAVAAALSELP